MCWSYRIVEEIYPCHCCFNYGHWLGCKWQHCL